MAIARYPKKAQLVNLAKTAGKIMEENFCLGMKISWKADNTPITEFDTRINRLVISWFAQEFPEISVIGEEESKIVKNSEYTALVDPIDGTVPFCHGIPVSTFCLSIIDNKNGRPVIGVIHDPFLKRTWHAEAGKGAFFNGKPARVSNRSAISNSLVSIMWWNTAKFNLCKACNLLVRKKAHCLNLFSVAICGGLIASGEMAASIFPSVHAWETAAMEIIVAEAGGKATDLYGDKIKYSGNSKISGHIISNGLIHDELVAIVKKSGIS